MLFLKSVKQCRWPEGKSGQKARNSEATGPVSASCPFAGELHVCLAQDSGKLRRPVGAGSSYGADAKEWTVGPVAHVSCKRQWYPTLPASAPSPSHVTSAVTRPNPSYTGKGILKWYRELSKYLNHPAPLDLANQAGWHRPPQRESGQYHQTGRTVHSAPVLQAEGWFQTTRIAARAKPIGMEV